jgi:hypothetical protein
MKTIALVAMAAVMLAGCNGKVSNDGRICTTPPPLDISGNPEGNRVNPGWQRQNADGCVHRWAYRLAGSPDPATTVADAVMGACQDTVFRTALAKDADQQKRQEPTGGFDTETGQDVNSYAEQWRELRNQALFNVVQARAGHCKIP